MRALLSGAAATMGLLVAACGTPDQPLDDPAGEAGEPRDAEEVDDRDEQAADGTTVLDLGDHCANPRDGYRLRYPEAWHANDGQVTASCRVFDVEVPQVEPATVLPLDSSALITVEDHRLDEMPTLIEDDPATEVQDVVETEIGGRRALRVDGVATGGAYLAEGVEIHRTYVAFGDRTVVGSINDVSDPDLDLRRELIAEMLATLEAIDRSDDGTGEAADGADAREETSEAHGEDATSTATGTPPSRSR